MYTSTLLTTFFAAASLSAAAPTMEKRSSCGISININVKPASENAQFESVPVEINQLTDLHDVSASSLSFNQAVYSDLNLDSVECRAYKDAAGIVPGSAPFTVHKPAMLSTNLVQVGSVLCYITEE